MEAQGWLVQWVCPLSSWTLNSRFPPAEGATRVSTRFCGDGPKPSSSCSSTETAFSTPHFPAKAVRLFEQEAQCAIVIGHLTELHPDHSIYNRLCAIEWRSPAGTLTSMNALGGIMAIRVSAFKEAGGFHLDAIAGEEPDLGARLMLLGYKIIKIDAPMATHDAQMHRFGQWWMRAVRGGHALAYRYARHGQSELRDGRREILSDLFWGLLLPLVSFAAAWPTRGVSLLLLAAAYGYFLFRVKRNYRRQGTR